MNFKTILACATLGLVLFSGRLNAAVESDIVGYQTIAMEAGKWYQFGCPFDSLDSDAVPTLATVFTTGFDAGDEAYIYSESAGSYTVTRTWGTPKAGGDATWLTARGKADDIELTPGHAIFIKKAVTNDVIVSGKVNATAVVDFGNTETTTWSQIVFPYPVDTDINDMKWEGLSNGDEVYVYDPVQGGYSSTRVWSAGNTADDVEMKWRTSRGKVTALKIPSGAAMFVYKKTAGKATLSLQ
jgi:hypothetical protein